MAKNRIFFFFSSLLCFHVYCLTLQFVPLSIKPGYSCIGLYGRLNDSRGIYISGDFARRLAHVLGSQYDTNLAIVATGVEVDELLDNVSLKKDYPGRSLIIVQPEFRVDFQILVYDQIDQGLVKEILPQKNLLEKTASTLRGLDYAKNTAIVFAIGNVIQLESKGFDKIEEIFYHRSKSFFFF